MTKIKLFKAVIKAALDFYEKKPWQECLNGHTFAVRVEEEEYPLFGSVMGGGGEEYGLTLTRGPHSGENMLSLLSGNEEVDDEIDTLGFSVDPLHKVPMKFRRPLSNARFSARRETLVPCFIAKPIRKEPRAINTGEAKLLLHIINGILKTIKEDHFKPTFVVTGKGIMVLNISGELTAPEVSISHEIFEIFSEDDIENITEVPDDDDFDSWKLVDRQLGDIVSNAVKNIFNTKTMEKYFGDEEEALYMFEEHHGAFGTFIEWLCFSYRSGRGKPTVAEKLLESGLNEPEQILLKNRVGAIPTFCKNIEVVARNTILVEDIFSGSKFEIHDRNLAESLRRNKEDNILPLYHYPAGNYRFVAMAGPNFSPLMLPEVLDFLAEIGLKPTEKGFEKKSHLLGILWDWYDYMLEEKEIPALNNTDGELMEWHTASYRIEDEEEFINYLNSRDDIDRDEQSTSRDFIWFRENNNSEKRAFGNTVLGRIELFGNEAITEVNSASRHREMRTWMEKIPSVKMITYKVRSIQDMMDNIPLDDECERDTSFEKTPEVTEMMNNYLRNYYLDWLDQPIPMFDNKTPRQTCQTKSGKLKVAALIRSLPSPPGCDEVIQKIRKELLKELGIE